MWMKKRYILDIGGESRTAVVATDREGNTAVQIDDGELKTVDAVRVKNGRALSLRIDGRMHLIDLASAGDRGGLHAAVRGRYVELSAMDELRALAQQSVEAAGGGGTVVAEIPGVVVSVAVEPGRKVREGESVLVLEAMKMQNEIAATATGTVEEVRVETGQSVNAGDVLVVITPEAGG